MIEVGQEEMCCEPLLWARSTIDSFGTCLQSVLTRFCVNPVLQLAKLKDKQAIHWVWMRSFVART